MKKLLSYCFKTSVVLVALTAVLMASSPLTLPAILGSEWAKRELSSLASKGLGRELKLGGAIDLELGIRSKLSIEKVFLANLAGSEEQYMLELDSCSLTAPLFPALLGNFEIDKIELRDAVIRVSEDSEGNSNWKFSKEESESKNADREGTAKIPGIRQLEIENVALQLNREPQKQNITIQKLDARDINFDSDGTLKSSVLIDKTALSLAAKFSSLSDFLSGQSLDFSLDLKQDKNELLTKGSSSLNNVTKLKFEASGDDLISLSTLLGTAVPDYGAYALNGQLSFEPHEGKQSISLTALNLQLAGRSLGGELFYKAEANNSSKIDLNLKMEESDLSGELRVRTSPLDLRAELRSKNLDLRLLTANDNDQEETKKSEATNPTIPFEALEKIQLDAFFKADRITTPYGFEVLGTEISANIDKGKLSIPTLHAKLFDGAVDGSFELGKEAVEVLLKAEHLDAAKITQGSSEQPILEGKLDLSSNLKAQGDDLSSILKTVSGDLSISSENSRLNNSTLNTASSTLGDILAPIFEDSSKTKSDCMILNFEIDNGIASSREQVFKLGQVFLFAEGKIDLSENDIKYNLHVNSENPALASLIPPFRAFGELTSPSFAPSVSGIVASIADSGEGILDSALSVAEGATELMLGDGASRPKGLEICRAAHEAEQKLISSQIGSLFESSSSSQDSSSEDKS